MLSRQSLSRISRLTALQSTWIMVDEYSSPPRSPLYGTTCDTRNVQVERPFEHPLRDEFTTEEIPGTVELMDLDNNNENQHEGREIILVPQPSSDPNDPLNWSRFRKSFFMFFAIASTFMGASVTSVIGITIPGFESVGISTTSVNRGSAYCFLLMGWLNVLVQPLAVSYGRRGFIIFGLLVAVVACPVWIAYSNSDGNYYASRVVQGIFESPFETLIEILVGDVFFVHDRAFWMGWYGFALNGGSFMGPIASAFVFSNMGYRWVYFFHSIFTGALCILMFFLMEESGYRRGPSIIEGVSARDGDSNGACLVGSQLGENAADIDARSQGKQDPGENKSLEKKGLPDTVEVGTVIDTYTVPAPNSCLTRMRLFSRIRPAPTWRDFVRPILVLYQFPHILWAGFMVASALSGFQILTGTISSVLMVPPYNFSVNDVGLAYIGPVVGMAVGCLYSGPLSDWHCLWLARRRGGVHEAEDRIWLGLACILLEPLGYFLYGIGAAHSVHWFVLVLGLSIVAAATAISSYALDACRELGSDAIVAIVLMRNTVSFAITFTITPWIQDQGLQNTFITVGFVLGVAFWITGVPMVLWGKRSRVKTAGTYFKWQQSVVTSWEFITIIELCSGPVLRLHR